MKGQAQLNAHSNCALFSLKAVVLTILSELCPNNFDLESKIKLMLDFCSANI